MMAIHLGAETQQSRHKLTMCTYASDTEKNVTDICNSYRIFVIDM